MEIYLIRKRSIVLFFDKIYWKKKENSYLPPSKVLFSLNRGKTQHIIILFSFDIKHSPIRLRLKRRTYEEILRTWRRWKATRRYKMSRSPTQYIKNCWCEGIMLDDRKPSRIHVNFCTKIFKSCKTIIWTHYVCYRHVAADMGWAI